MAVSENDQQVNRPDTDTSTILTSDVEGQHLDRKSLSAVIGPKANLPDLAKDCICFANGSGGQILIGIEDGETHPPADQRIKPDHVDRIRKRIGELTVNVHPVIELRQDENGGAYIVIRIERAHSVASTTDGRFFVRIADTCVPVTGDDIMRLVDERPGVRWETMTSLGVSRSNADALKVEIWVASMRDSERVKASVKEKTDDELLEHYDLADGKTLTNLGILLVGTTVDRRKLSTAPVVQVIQYDERENKIGKYVWDDHSLSPIELIDDIWNQVPSFRESYELPEGMLRTSVPAFEEVVVRELLVNALVHRPYTQRGDIFLNLHPDRLEIVNPGRLPLGVTPQNILHQHRRRNDGLARMFHDLKLMEREGSGFDLMYDHLLSSGRGAPSVTEGSDSVHVIIQRRIPHPGIIRLIKNVNKDFDLAQRERIALSLLAQAEGLSIVDLVRQLELQDAKALRPWIERLIELGLIHRTGRTKDAYYFVSPKLLRDAGLEIRTNLKQMELHHLQAFILEDIESHPDSSSTDIHRRIGHEIPKGIFARGLKDLVDEGRIIAAGERRWRRYHPNRDMDKQGTVID